MLALILAGHHCIVSRAVIIEFEHRVHTTSKSDPLSLGHVRVDTLIVQAGGVDRLCEVHTV